MLSSVIFLSLIAAPALISAKGLITITMKPQGDRPFESHLEIGGKGLWGVPKHKLIFEVVGKKSFLLAEADNDKRPSDGSWLAGEGSFDVHADGSQVTRVRIACSTPIDL
ncbi:uncharacterized protein MKK02DRAFT_27828 [Dioszegia hungarica]|uniref:Uncharacterized protein n=1 Tax=Dioszegia hungarica TaxID=4972 RepID=A0AA38H6C8_9TREE|nr:uncharacterized protein MKK02DRAFT_27828 [Dioszegia hungarica]KAI9634657.1 hypothetical protein MKK02DRAFT_27828 [Dioszegia hungarica]